MSLPFRRPLRRVSRACGGDAVGRAGRSSAPDVSSGPRAPPVESATGTRKEQCIVRRYRFDNQRSMITLTEATRENEGEGGRTWWVSRGRLEVNYSSYDR